jgi:thiamine pyrophosphate-dependent acetolactate synthase large subunit-like protein
MLPLDVQAAEAAAAPLPAALELDPARPAAASVARAAEALAAARRPLIIAGRGALLAGAGPALEALGQRLGALLATSAAANGLFAGNPWALGISGGFASPAAARLIGASDVVLGAGVAFNMWTTRHGRLLDPAAVVIQVDSDAAGIAAHHRVDVGVVGDARETAIALEQELAGRGHQGSGRRVPAVAAGIAAGGWRDEPYDDQGTEDRIDPRTFSIALEDVLPEERTLAIDSGHFMGWPAMYLTVPDALGFVFTQAFQSVGLGLASAIGAAVARPDRLTVAALGDGGFLMGLSELETAARLRPRLLIAVYNDAAYGAEVHHFGPQGAALDVVRFPDTDLAALARGAGLEAATVRCAQDLAVVRDWLERGSPTPLLLDTKVVPTVVAEWLEEAFRGH